MSWLYQETDDYKKSVDKYAENIVYYLGSSHADVAELADAPDLGSGVPDVQVQVLSSAFVT